MATSYTTYFGAALLCYAAQIIASQQIYTIDEDYRPSPTPPKPTTPKPVYCPVPFLENGEIQPDKDSYGPKDRVIFNCFDGYTRRGKRLLTCLESGEWDIAFPFCKEKPKYCSRRLLQHGSIVPNRPRYGDKDVVIYKCKDGYILKGNQASGCFGGQWSADLPECEAEPKKCSYPDLMHGTVSPRKPSYEDKSVVVFNCNKDYVLEGAQAAACFGGEWSHDLPQCTASKTFSPSEVYCLAPDFPRGSYNPQPASGKDYPVGSSISFRCRGVYNIKGSRTAECLATGKWDRVPVCQAGCRVPKISNGYYNTDAKLSGSYYEPGQKVSFGCNQTYKLKGRSSARCRSSGEWSIKLPVCEKLIISIKEVGCVPPVFPTGSYTPILTGGKTVYSVGERIVFACSIGYHVKGVNYATCRDDGKWSAVPTCSDECAALKVDYGSVYPAAGPYKVNSKAVLKCKTGYLPVGPSQATCLPSGVWSAQLRCTDGCYAPNIAHMNILPAPASGGNVYEFGHRIRFSCDAGFSTNVREAECRGRNSWDKTLPKCRLLAAGEGCPMPVLPEGLVLKNQQQAVFAYKTQLEFSCGKGFSMVGSAVSICRKHLRGPSAGWDPALPVCNRAKCGAPGKPQNGRFRDGQKEAYYFGDTVYFECDKKHIMSGNDHITCQADGQFSGVPPKCQPPSCRVECVYVEGRDCQCDRNCRFRKNCCYDFEQHCRKLFY